MEKVSFSPVWILLSFERVRRGPVSPEGFEDSYRLGCPVYPPSYSCFRWGSPGLCVFVAKVK